MLAEKAQPYRNKVKERFDKCSREDTLVGDMVLRWEERKDDKKRHKKFANMWLGPFKIAKVSSTK